MSTHQSDAKQGSTHLSVKDGQHLTVKDPKEGHHGNELASPAPTPTSPIDVSLCEAGPLQTGNPRKHWLNENQMLDTHRFYDNYCTPNVKPADPPAADGPGPLDGSK
jgi:hypothetical protein